MENRLARARREAERDDAFIDLIDTSFHRCGLRYPPERLGAWAREWFDSPEVSVYDPHPAGSPRTREAIARLCAAEGWGVDPAQVVVTASASESYGHVFAALCPRGSVVLLPQPGYPLFEDVARRHGLLPRFYELSPERGWQPDPDEISELLAEGGGPTGHAGATGVGGRRAGRPTGAVVLISPNNPTGTIVPTPTAEAIAAVCAARDVLLIVDEVFSAFVYGVPADDGAPAPQTAPRPARLVSEARVCTINGASKLFASPDLKVSWVIVSGPPGWTRRAVGRIETQNDLFLSATPLSGHLLARMVDEDDGFTRDLVARVERRRAVLVDALGALRAGGAPVRWIEPNGGIHLAVILDMHPDAPDDEAVAVALLAQERVAVHPGYLYGVGNRTVLVTSFLAPEERIREGVRRLGRCLDRIYAGP